MTRYQIQLLRYIGLRPGLSARKMGIHRQELTPLMNNEFVQMDEHGYLGRSVELTKKGKEFLASIQAETYGNPEWDDKIFMGMMSRKSLHVDQNEN